MPKYSHPCLFCGDDDRERTIEHVLQNGLGGTMTLPVDVCGECNTAVFSPLDSALIRYIQRLAFIQHPDVGASRSFLRDLLLTFDEPSGQWHSVRLDNQLRPVLLTQIVFENDVNILEGRPAVSIVLDGKKTADPGPVIRALQQELAQPESIVVERLVTPERDETRPIPQPALVRSAPSKYLARGATPEAAEMVAAWATRGVRTESWGSFDAPRASTTETPWVHGLVKIEHAPVERALAKIALNFVCKTVGPAAARHAELDALRRFARYGEEPDQPLVHLFPAGTGDPVGSFVVEHFGRPDCHTLFLIAGRVPALVSVCLYGRPFALVRLANQPVSSAIPEDTIIAASFNYKARTHECAAIADDFATFASMLQRGDA